MTGSMIGHYRVLGLLGEGGMGAVYRASDTKLGREVALKVLPESFANDADRLARFGREAQVLAQLNHPNIAAIYGVERNALVLELVQGVPARGPLGLDELRAVAGQIIDALEAAHERGIVHRDLKPANVLLTPDGTVKVLDFGLAKALSAPENLSPENSPTLTMGATMAGVILGTASYMAPEQARGGRIDHRADIWAFGCVVFELATGRALFGGESVSDILAAVLRAEIPFDEAPEALRPLLRRCLERDARKRLGWIGEARGMLAPAVVEVKSAPASSTRRGWLLGGAGLIVGGGIGYWAGRGGTGTTGRPRLRFTISVPDLADQERARNVAIAPDGRWLAYVAGGKLWLRDMGMGTARGVGGTDGAEGPVWAPDSRSVVYWAQAQLWRVGPPWDAPRALCRLFEYHGAAFRGDGRVIYVDGVKTGYLEVPAEGGEPKVLHKGPYTSNRFQAVAVESGGATWMIGTGFRGMRAVNLKSGETREIGPGQDPVLTAGGQLIFRNGGRLQMAPFAASGLALTGPAVDVAPGGHMPSVSDTGLLVYSGTGSEEIRLAIRGRKGEALGTAGTPQKGVLDVAASPDGTVVAVSSSEQGSPDIWIHEVSRPVKRRLTSGEGLEMWPQWTPDGRKLIYASERRRAEMVDADGTGQPAPLAGLAEQLNVSDVSRDGNRLLLWKIFGADGTNETLVGERRGERWETRAWLTGPFDESFAKFSRDSKFVAYVSNESGSYDVYVRHLEGSGKWRVSTNGGVQPRWSRDGRELFYLEGSKLMAVTVSGNGEGLTLGTPVALFDTGAYGTNRINWKYDELPGGRFVVLERAGEGKDESRTIYVAQGWDQGRPGGPGGPPPGR